jgi:DNA-binding response OmpR family regulator
MIPLSLTALPWRPRKTILVVDDDPDLRLGLEIRLKANGYDVVFATNGEESIAAAGIYSPDLILLDLGLPLGDGYSVMERLSASNSMHLIPVIILSARDIRPDRDRSLQGGAYTFLQKPPETADLIGAICKALGQPRRKPTRAEKQRLAAESDVKLLNRIVS